MVKLGGVEQTVGVKVRRFPCGGGWSLFVAPCCGNPVRVLRLLEGAMVCTRCCTRRGVRFRCESMSVRQRAELRIQKLRAMLESKQSLRLKPVLWERWSAVLGLRRDCANASFVRLRCGLRGKLKQLSIHVTSLILRLQSQGAEVGIVS